MSNVKLPNVWKKSICYTCKYRSGSGTICCKNLVMAIRGKKYKDFEKEEVEE